MKKLILRCFVPAILAVAWSGCQSMPGSDVAVDLDVRVFASDRGDGIKEVWVVDARNGRKLEPLLEGPSLEIKTHFSPRKDWLALDDKVMESFRAVRLFHHEPSGGFRRIPEEEFLLGPWRAFLADEGISENDLSLSSATVDAWKKDGEALVIRMEATRRDGKKFTRMLTVTLPSLE